jgi:hypothetical protein
VVSLFILACSIQTYLFHFTGSEKNASMLTLDGVDVMGERLANEVNVAGS